MVPASARQEFMLLPADVAADRETPALAVDSEGRVLMAWASQTGELERTLYLARSSDGGAHFEPPVAWRKVPIYRYTSKGRAGGSGMTYSTHVLPRLASAGAEINLGWVEAIDGGPKVVYYVARSSDGGRSFSSPMPVHGASTVRPGFTTLAADPDGTLLAGWLESPEAVRGGSPQGLEFVRARAARLRRSRGPGRGRLSLLRRRCAADRRTGRRSSLSGTPTAAIVTSG